MKASAIIKNKIHLIVIIVIFVVLAYNFVIHIYDNVGYTPEQPINFSHKIHAGDNKIECIYCHSTAEKGPHAGIPTTEQCMGCHSVVAIDKEEIQKLTAIYNEGKAVEWVRVHRLPDHAYFSHEWHVNAGIACETCHGEVSEMAVISQVNRLEMGDCLQCHRNSDYTEKYLQQMTLGDSTSIANNYIRYQYLKYIHPATLESSQKAGMEAKYIDNEGIKPATGVVPHQNAPVQCNICHN